MMMMMMYNGLLTLKEVPSIVRGENNNNITMY